MAFVTYPMGAIRFMAAWGGMPFPSASFSIYPLLMVPRASAMVPLMPLATVDRAPSLKIMILASLPFNKSSENAPESRYQPGPYCSKNASFRSSSSSVHAMTSNVLLSEII
mgnify:CR=1 FL=1